MRKIILMALASYLWKRFRQPGRPGAGDPLVTTPVTRVPPRRY